MKVIADFYGVSSNTVRDWYQNKGKLLKFVTESAINAADRKSVKCTCGFIQSSRGLPTSGTIIKEKTVILSQKLPDEKQIFKASEGWLHRGSCFMAFIS